jgi:hypothetical protein
MHVFHDDLRAIARALPERFTKSATAYTEFLDDWAEQRPDYFLQPITIAEGAAFMGATKAAWLKRCDRHGGPATVELNGVLHYPSRLALLHWVQAELELQAAEKEAA